MRSAAALALASCVGLATLDCRGLGAGDDELAVLPVGGDLSRLLADNAPMRPEAYGNDVKLLFFGYTRCPDVCPNALGRAAAISRRLEADGLADRFLVYFVSVDPERDTPAGIAEYLSFFGLRGIALTGSVETVGAVAREFGAWFQKVDSGSEAGYLLDHTTYLYLLDRQGRVRRLVQPEDETERVAAWIRTLLAEPG